MDVGIISECVFCRMEHLGKLISMCKSWFPLKFSQKGIDFELPELVILILAQTASLLKCLNMNQWRNDDEHDTFEQ